MPDRKRLLAGLAVAALGVGAVLVLRTPSDDVEPPVAVNPPPERVVRYAADSVVLPAPGPPPAAPFGLEAVPGRGSLALHWTGAEDAPGYRVSWPGGSRLVAGPETQLDGLRDGESVEVSVRTVDEYGRVSEPASVTAAPDASAGPDGRGFTGLWEDFATDAPVVGALPGSRWHLSGYRGCVDVGERRVGQKGLPVLLACGADVAVLRARTPFVLGEGPELGRVAVLTDAAGPGGRLTLDLVPGPADRVDSALPEGAVRAVVDDFGAQLLPAGERAPDRRRGVGVLHLYEVVVEPTRVVLKRDGETIALTPYVPTWREAYVLIGVRGPQGRRAQVRVAGAGFTGEARPVPDVVEVPVSVATRQVLRPGESPPRLGIARRPLVTAKSGRFIATITANWGVDLNAVTVQLGQEELPARPVAPVRPGPGAVVTVAADLPPHLLGPDGPESLSPLAVRAPGADRGTTVVESYLELQQGPGAAFPTEPAYRQPLPKNDSLPLATVTLGGSSGAPLESPSVPAGSRLVVRVALSGRESQWDTGAVGGALGFQLWLDGRLVASVPTAEETGAPGGTYAVALATGGLALGGHVLETRVLGAGSTQSSTVTRFGVG